MDLTKFIQTGLRPLVSLQPLSEVSWSLSERMERYHVPGLSAAVWQNGELSWSQGFGLVEAGGQETVDPDTVFQAASISKPVAALATLRLVEQGVLGLDVDVNEYLKSWRLPENEFTRQQPVTIAALLSHTAGLTVHGFDGYACGAPLPTLPQILDGASPANSAPIQVEKQPGTIGSYSGGGYVLLQQLLMDLTGQPFEALADELVLQPLGMSHSQYGAPKGRPASGHLESGKTVEGGWHVYPELCAAGLWTTPSDLARFGIAVQRSRTGQGLISQPLTEAMLTLRWPNRRPSVDAMDDTGAGLGLFITETPQGKFFGHSGSNAGYQCKLLGSFDGRFGVAVMTNGDGGAYLVPELVQGLAEGLGWPGFSHPTRQTVSLPPDRLATYAGKYEFFPGMRVVVEARADHLTAWQEKEIPLVFEFFPVSETEFFALEALPPLLFRLNPDGQVEGITFYDMPAKKVL